MSENTGAKDPGTAKVKRSSGRIPPKEISVFCAQTAMLLEAGIPLHDGLKSMSDSSIGTGVSLIKGIAEKVGETGSLYEALGGTGAFPSYMVQMVRIGEAVGKLEEVLTSLSAYYKREGKIRDAVRGAVLYPVILIFLMAAVITVMVVLVLPVFSDVFASLGTDVTGNVVESGAVIGKITSICMAVLLLIVLVILAVALSREGRAMLIKSSQNLPFLKKVYRQMASSRFALVISMMLTSGFDLDEALKMSVGVVSDETVQSKIEQCRKKIGSGKSFSETLLEIGLFSGLNARMIETGERAGRLDDAMDQLAETYSDEVDQSISTLISVIEPTLVIFLSVIIGAILLSVMLPLVQIMTQIS